MDENKKVRFMAFKYWRDEACKKSTLKSVVTTLGLAFLTPEKVLDEEFQNQSILHQSVHDIIINLFANENSS